ncbi:MAG TPA: AAA family ATPase [Candidatus Acidoferrum sp.]|nr:AAA family ATPase [Candidatus Acidoferrum sp.]
MLIEFVEIQNFRKLKAIRIDFARDTTLFVGANNSGKTSAMSALRYFLVDNECFQANDFTLSNWISINKIGEKWQSVGDTPNSPAPTLFDWETLLPSLDLWLSVRDDEVHRVSRVLPTLGWSGGLLGVRLRYEPKKIDDLYSDYLSSIRKVNETMKGAVLEGDSASPHAVLWPRDMHEFLERKLGTYFGVRAYCLDPDKQESPINGMARPQALPGGIGPIDGDPLKGLIRIRRIDAQRDFADVYSGRDRPDADRGGEKHKLTKQLRAYYDNHLDPAKSPEPSDLEALGAIRSAEKLFDLKLKIGFSSALGEVEGFGYPGGTDPKLTIATKIRLTDGLDHPAAVQYEVLPTGGMGGSGPLLLPEDYNGLGYQNLISMVFRLMSFRDEWMQVGKAKKTDLAESADAFSPEPLHLILIEEPEAHLHAQVQQVFINKAYKLLRSHKNLGDNPRLSTQLVVSTHSGHVAHECEFEQLRYFRRRPPLIPGGVPITTVANLSRVFGDEKDTKRFVTRYLKTTHFDLFFADAAILVEGPAERILVPQFLRNEFRELCKSYVSLLEIGGSHAHRLSPLIESLGLTTLIITDLDAMLPSGLSVAPARGQGQITRNATLKQRVPEKKSLDELLDATAEDKVKIYDNFFSIRVAYQFPLQIKPGEESATIEALPNTFEDALVYDNLQIFTDFKGDGKMKEFKEVVLEGNTTEALGRGMFKILAKLKKAEFALDLLDLKKDPWPIKSPTYIREGLFWLQDQLQRKEEELSAPSPPQTLGKAVSE